MSLLKRFARYAEAFEETYDDDDWSRLKEYFTEDAVYEAKAPFNARAVGVDAVLEHFRGSVDAFDRKFAERRLLPTRPPAADGDRVVMEWEATYETPGAPELRMRGTETAFFRGERICRLEDEFAPDLADTVATWMAAHGAKLAGA
jgi:hypothetical protein